MLAATVQIESQDELSSGVIISAAGHVLTVAHGLWSKADAVNVRLSSGKRMVARILARNTSADVAVLQLQQTEPQPLPFLPLADDVSMPQRLVLACGFPAREGQAASAVVRCGQLVATGRRTIRSSCMLTAGDSGGPLVNAGGAVLGIHQRIGLGRHANLHLTVSACAEAVRDDLNLASVASVASVASDDGTNATNAGSIPSENEQLTVSDVAMKRWQDLTVMVLARPSDTAAAAESVPASPPAAEPSSKLLSQEKDSAKAGSMTAAEESERQLAWGTVFSPALVVTKFSSLPPQTALQVKTTFGDWHAAHVIRSSQPLDLALLQLSTPLAHWVAESAEGKRIASSLQNGGPVQVGQLMFANDAGGISILARIAHREPDARPKLGCGLQQQASVLTVDAVSPHSAAADMELQVGDEVQSLNHRVVRTLDDVAQILQSLQPGDRLTAEVQRQQQRLIRHGQLRHAPATLLSRAEFLDGHAGTLSTRRTGFAAVLQHDAALSANQMGGPVCDLQGRIIGVNIARRARESVLAVPLAVVHDFVAPHLSSAD